MYLALKEIWHEKRRYLLILLVISMISYLVFFLSSLAFGLAQANRSAIDAWAIDGIVLSIDSNQNISASSLDLEKQKDIQADFVEPITLSLQVVYDQNNSRHNVAFVGLNTFPEPIEGETPTTQNEALASQAVQTLYGITIGDSIRIAKTGQVLTITGLTPDERYNTSPVVYTELNTSSTNVTSYRQNTIPSSLTQVNGFFIRGFQQASGMDYLTKKDWIQALPGYQAQVLTFGLMIGFLILISASILGIFIYILTLQKKTIFGILKAQGIQSHYLTRSIFYQTLILVVIGIAVGILSTFLTLLSLPKEVPISFAWSLYGIVSLCMILFSLCGAFFSGRLIAKIDPLQAIE